MSLSEKTGANHIEIGALRQQLEQEKAARRDAESIAEQGSRSLYERARHLELLENITAQANSNEDFASVLIFVLQKICLFCGCPAGHILWQKMDIQI